MTRRDVTKRDEIGLGTFPNAEIGILYDGPVQPGARVTVQHRIMRVLRPVRLVVDPLYARSWLIEGAALGNLPLLEGPIGGASCPPFAGGGRPFATPELDNARAEQLERAPRQVLELVHDVERRLFDRATTPATAAGPYRSATPTPETRASVLLEELRPLLERLLLEREAMVVPRNLRDVPGYPGMTIFLSARNVSPEPRPFHASVLVFEAPGPAACT